MKYSCIVSDPPWQFEDELKSMGDLTQRGAASQYPVLSPAEIIKLPVSKIADPEGCLLALWVPSVLLDIGLETMSSWGFNFKQTFIWVKTKSGDNAIKKIIETKDLNDSLAFGMGRLFRQSHELALIGTNNNGVYRMLTNKSQRSVLFDENKGHSIKPEGLQDRLDIMYPGAKKLEMFARRQRPGWECVGNQVLDGEDIRDTLKRLTEDEKESKE